MFIKSFLITLSYHAVFTRSGSTSILVSLTGKFRTDKSWLADMRNSNNLVEAEYTVLIFWHQPAIACRLWPFWQAGVRLLRILLKNVKDLRKAAEQIKRITCTFLSRNTKSNGSAYFR